MKLAFRAAPTAEARRALDTLHDLYGTHAPEDADVIVPLGGDGYMLETLHTFLDLAKPIYGMNLGTVGFLLNSFGVDGLQERIGRAQRVRLYPLRMRACMADGRTEEAIGINEVSIYRESRQAARLRMAKALCIPPETHMSGFPYLTQSGFIGAAPAQQQPFAIAGIPWDGSVTNRPGARFGPRAIRQASQMLCDATHPLFDVSPIDRLGDVGDLDLPNTGIEAMRAALAPLLPALVLDVGRVVVVAADRDADACRNGERRDQPLELRRERHDREERGGAEGGDDDRGAQDRGPQGIPAVGERRPVVDDVAQEQRPSDERGAEDEGDEEPRDEAERHGAG